MTKPYLVTAADLKVGRFRRRWVPVVAAAFLAFAVLLTEPAPEAPAPPVVLERRAPPPVRPPATRKARADYERAVYLYAQGRLRDSIAILERHPDDPSAARALSRIRADLAEGSGVRL